MTTVQPLDFKSQPAMWTGLIGSIVLMGASMLFWYALGPEITDQVTGLQRGTLIFFVLVMISIMLSIGYSRLWANADGVTVRNMFRVRTFTLDQIAGVRFREGDPWAFLLLHDPNSDEPKRHAILAIQSLEREAATAKVLKLRQWLDVQLSGEAVGGELADDVDEPDEQ